MKLPTDYTKLHSSKRKKVREQYVNEQQGLCYYCKEPLDGNPSKSVQKKTINRKLFPEHFFKHPVHLHHDHTTGMTIGAVHCQCNAVMWQYLGE